jgi:hypothetical protein
MSYITREDGERFVIPSYRDVLSSKQKNQLKNDILSLSQSYGEYITLQRKSSMQYEVAFSPDPGYLLGESIWHYFKRPLDMIYCEAVPNTTEAILVIVKGGSVYLDGRFPLEGIPEELVVFLTQKNNFDIYIYGNVPISEQAIEGKFSFDAHSIKSFNILVQPVFVSLPLLKIYQLQLVEPVLKAQGIGVFPVRQTLILFAILGMAWMLYHYLTLPSKVVQVSTVTINPYQEYIDSLTTPAPDQQINQLMGKLALLFTLPGWNVNSVQYANGNMVATVKTAGSKIKTLFNWVKNNNAKAIIKADGIDISLNINAPRRNSTMQIYPIQEVIAKLVDKIALVYPGNNLSLAFVNKGSFTDVKITIQLPNISPTLLVLIAHQFKNLPLVLQNVTLTVNNGMINGSIIIDALGS